MSFCLQGGALLAQAQEEVASLLGDIGLALGTAGQMVNDLADLLPPRLAGPDLNGYKTPYSDIRNGRVTYPLFHLFSRCDQQDQTFLVRLLGAGYIGDQDGEHLLRLLCTNGTIIAIRRLVAKHYYTLKKELRGLPSCEARDMLSVSFSSLLTNKYFVGLREQEDIRY